MHALLDSNSQMLFLCNNISNDIMFWLLLVSIKLLVIHIWPCTSCMYTNTQKQTVSNRQIDMAGSSRYVK